MECKSRDFAQETTRAARERAERIAFFWSDMVPDRLERFGWTEAECLRRFPEFKGTKPDALTGAHGERQNVIAMPPRDRKSAAAGDRDDAA